MTQWLFSSDVLVCFLQSSEWQWIDKTVKGYAAGHPKTLDCTFRKTHNNMVLIHNTLNNGITTKYFDNAHENHKCAVLEILPNHPVVSAVDCSAKFDTNIVCMDKYTAKSSPTLREILQQQMVHRKMYSGFSIDESDNGSKLESSVYSCPKGYNYFIDHSCVKIVPYHLPIPLYDSCLIQYNNGPCNEARERKHELSKFDIVCREENASILNITLPSDDEPWDTIQSILDEIMYSKYISISSGFQPFLSLFRANTHMPYGTKPCSILCWCSCAPTTLCALLQNYD